MAKNARGQEPAEELVHDGNVAVRRDGEWLRRWTQRGGWQSWDRRSDANCRPGDSIYPAFDWIMIRLLDGRWATSEELAEWAKLDEWAKWARHGPLRRSYGWFDPDTTFINEWLKSA